MNDVIPEPEGIYRATWLPEVFSHDVFQQSSWRLAKDAPRELENAGPDTPRVFQGIDAIVLDEAHDCTAPMLDICACVLQRKQCSWVTTGWASARSLMQASTANVVPDGQQRLLSTTNDVTIYIYTSVVCVVNTAVVAVAAADAGQSSIFNDCGALAGRCSIFIDFFLNSH